MQCDRKSTQKNSKQANRIPRNLFGCKIKPAWFAGAHLQAAYHQLCRNRALPQLDRCLLQFRLPPHPGEAHFPTLGTPKLPRLQASRMSSKRCGLFAPQGEGQKRPHTGSAPASNVSHMCEVGYHGGHSATVALFANPAASLTVFNTAAFPSTRDTLEPRDNSVHQCEMHVSLACLNHANF